MKHIDEFIDNPFNDDKYARWVFNHFRLSASLKNAFAEFMSDCFLFCTYKGKRMRCTGASRLGDVWLTSDFNQDVGYELRVIVEDCSEWSKSKALASVELLAG